MLRAFLPIPRAPPKISVYVSYIDHRTAEPDAHPDSITVPPSAATGDREPRNAPAQKQGSVVSSSKQLFTAIERPRCSRCQTRMMLMMLERVSAGSIGIEHRLFKCLDCNHVETRVIASDPLKSRVLAGELREPN
jgi:hypothetical protein